MVVTHLGSTKNTSNKEEIESDDEALEKVLHESADSLLYCGVEAWQGASMDKKSTSSQKKLAHKKLNVEKKNERHYSNNDDLGEIKITALKN